MEYIHYLIVLTPMLFLPLILWDIFTLPQTALLSAATAIGIVGLGLTNTTLQISLPVLLSIILIFYMAVNSLWTEVLDGARKEFILQLSLLLVFLLAVHLDKSSIHKALIVAFCGGFLIQLYGVAQTFGKDWIFPYRLKVKKDDRRPIGSIGNTNFFSSYIVSLFWIGIYLAVVINPVFLIGNVVSLYILHKAKCRGAWLGIIGSSYVLVLLFGIRFLGVVNPFVYFWSLLGFAFCVGTVYWLIKNWQKINHTRIDHTKNEGGNNPAKARLSTLRYRLSYWRSGWELFLEKPLQGHGLRSYRKLVYYAQAKIHGKDPEYLDQFRYITPQPRECHNDWLEDLVELGIVGSLIRFGLVGSILFIGISAFIATGNLQLLFFLAVMVACSIHAVFFFGLRLPSTGMIFWLCAGFIISIVHPTVLYNIIFTPWMALGLFLPIFAVLYWETTVKSVMASYCFMKFQSDKKKDNLPGKKEKYCLETIKWSPEETIYNTHALIGYIQTNPHLALKYAERMWHNYDGMTPGWVMHFNMGTIAEAVGNKELAYRHYLTSHRLLPSFEPTLAKLAYLDQFMPLPRKGEPMKQIGEAARANTLLLNEKIITLETQKQLMQANIQNIVLQEAARLNIPSGWQYIFEEGVFMSPEEIAEYQKQKNAGVKTGPVQPQPPLHAVSDEGGGGANG